MTSSAYSQSPGKGHAHRFATDWSRLLWPVGLTGSVALGLLVGRGSRSLGLLVVSAVCAGAAMLVIKDRLLPALLLWVPLSVAAYPWLRIPREEPLLTFDRGWISVMVGAMLLATILGERAPATSSATRLLAVALGCMVVAFALRIVLATLEGDPSYARTLWVDAVLLPAGLFFLARRTVRDARACRRLTGALTIAGAGLGLVGIAQHIWGFELASLSGGQARYDATIELVRISGPYNIPEVFALSLTLCFAATLHWMQAGRAVAFMLGGIAAALEMAAIGLTLFRAAWLACVVIAVATLTTRRDRSARTVGLVTLGGILLVGLHLFGSIDVVSERLNESDNVYGRLATYRQGWEIFRGAPLVGVGVDQFTAGQELVADVVVNGTRAVETAHSTYVSILAEQGLLGFVPLLGFSFATWRLLRRLRRHVSEREELLALGAFRGAVLAYLILSLTLTMWPYGTSNAFLFVLVGAAAGRLESLDGNIPSP